ncbi:hypothetical protein GOC91_06740 [Sinorhizobium medicae]|uniref:Uncharacterized protein n=1 Tax=Sinorhizobium medicae (strain WSM419) TaxID=366394 RepID=A6UML8_SINMW|nr:hypothetical protein Smed_6301 [Sinorhizobium medicae WSM419]MDX0405018.1 hypothetical protein [Sinorhizobium medicae]MDX0412013.1 hypothetical protein [Sinorhizobium medicae]MDX0416672.1 hypothetical protein [Sinorhizobium medicae]MDX0424015.1 hypothetical protein [Sinorhizobium medicae]
MNSIVASGVIRNLRKLITKSSSLGSRVPESRPNHQACPPGIRPNKGFISYRSSGPYAERAARVTKNAPICTAGVLLLLLERFEKRTHLPKSGGLRHDDVQCRMSPRSSLQGVHTVHSFKFC